METTELIPFNNGGKWGFCDAAKEIIIACEYDYVSFFRDGVAIVRNGVFPQDWRCGMINTSGKRVIPMDYAQLEQYSDGLAKAREYGKTLYCYIDSEGKNITHNAYKTAHTFSEGLAYIEFPEQGKLCKRGFINTSGEIEIDRTSPFFENCVHDFQNDIAIMEFEVPRGTLYSYLQRNGQELRDAKGQTFFLHVAPFVNGVAGIWDESGAFRIINTRGETLFDAGFEYDNCSGEFHDGLLRVRKGKNWGFVDSTGKELIPCMIDFERIGDFYDGFAWFQEEKDGKYGVVNRMLETAVPAKFDMIDNAAEGYFCAQKAGKYGFLQTNGGIAIAFDYDFASNFEDGFALVRQQTLKFYIDVLGNQYTS